MKTYTLTDRPLGLSAYRETALVNLSFQREPFVVETQEGPMTISPKTVDDWEDGYWVAYPTDGSKPYAISPSFVRSNYENVGGEQ